MRPSADPEAAIAHGLFSRQQALVAGYTADGILLRVRRGEWIRCGRGVLRRADREDQPGDRVLLAVLAAGRTAVASHRSAAFALDWDLLVTDQEPEVLVPRTHGRVAVPGVTVRRCTLGSHEVALSGVLPLTTPERTATDLAAAAPLVEAVVAIDAAFRLGHLTPMALKRALRDRGPLPTRPQAQEAVGLADPTSGSMPETVARLLFVRAGLPAPLCQYEVYLDGTFVARTDFAWPEQRLVVEIDGFEFHSGRTAFQEDRARQNALQLAGWRVLRFTVEDVLHAAGAMVAQIRRALVTS